MGVRAVNDDDAITELAAALDAAAAKVTLDPGAAFSRPCTFCGKLPTAFHSVFRLGTYHNGQLIRRPVCDKCVPLVARYTEPAPLSVIEGEHIRWALLKCERSVIKAAKVLRIGRATIYRFLQREAKAHGY